MPKIYFIPTDSPNAFATGRNPSHASVAVTRGILEICDDEEIEGVLAHELGHVKNRDILTSAVVATLAGAITLIGRMLWYAEMFGGFGGGGRGNGRRGGALSMLAMMILAPLAATLIQLAISRSREYEADHTGARDYRQSPGSCPRPRQDRQVGEARPHAGRALDGAPVYLSAPHLGSNLFQPVLHSPAHSQAH